ncbi:hypothetical protein QQP08_018276 [Theobroma cacao]|nr:hypothetical protein QQP08_018276 [Theobroma cacao]
MNKAGFLDEAVTANSQAPGKPWELNPQRLATVQEEVTVEQPFRDAETIVEFALDEDGSEVLLRLETMLQIAQEWSKQAIETSELLIFKTVLQIAEEWSKQATEIQHFLD